MKKSLLTLLTLSAFLFMPNIGKATDYTIETIPAPASPSISRALPLVCYTSSASAITQQIYLASELTELGASAGDVTGIKLYYGGINAETAVPAVSRNVKIYMSEIVADTFKIDTIIGAYLTKYRFKFVNQGNLLVHDGNISTEAIAAGEYKTLTITFNQSSFSWDGTKNILLTIFDVTNTAYSSEEANLRFVLKSTEYPRYVHQKWTANGDHKASDYLTTLAGQEGETFTSGTGSATEREIRGHRWVPKTTFAIVTPVPVPTSPSAGGVTANSAVLSWTAAAGADSYEVRYGTTSGSLGAPTNVGNVTSYSLSELVDETTYYYQIRTKKGTEYSVWTDEASFTTSALAAHTHDDITFSKWASTTELPTSGNYYLNDDVAFDIMSSDVTLTGNLNLCLNGKTADIYGSKIIVPSGKTLTIYDNEGGGKITGRVASEVGISEDLVTSLIVVKLGGTLVLKQGTIENAYIPDADGSSYAIYSNGTLRLSGDVLINSNDADIYLYSTNIITLDGAISNAEKHTVWKNGGAFTSGWSTYMSGENPRDFFESANSARSVCLDEGEAALQLLLNLSETALNSAINSNDGQVVDVNLTRPLVASQYNTLCLPFALTADQMEEYFGAGYELWELESSSLDGEQLSLAFERKYALEAGKPYLLQPASAISSVMFFDDMTIVKTLSNTVTSYVDFKGVYGTTSLEGGNKNLLFLGAGNELFYPAEGGNNTIKGFRAYFEVKGGAQGAKRARIVKKEEGATGIESQMVNGKCENGKFIKDGQLLILRDNKTYNVLGMEYK